MGGGGVGYPQLWLIYRPRILIRKHGRRESFPDTSTSTMESEKKGDSCTSSAFDAAAASGLVEGLRVEFSSGKTRSYQWRERQLKCLLRMTEENEQEIARTLREDLSKPELEAFIFESLLLVAAGLRNPLRILLAMVSENSHSGHFYSSCRRRFSEYSMEEKHGGNGKVGRIVMAAATKHLTPVQLELGGKSPVVVDSGIDLKVSCRRIIAGKWGCNNGQACISPDYVITTKDYAPKLVDALKHELQRFYGKNQMESNDLSRIVNSNHFSRLSKLLDDDKVSGKVVHGGERDESKLKIAPTLLLDVPRDSLIMKEEIFGPLLPILTVDRIEESCDIINSGTKPLAAYLFTNDKKLTEKFVMSVSAGGLAVNDTITHFGVPSLPFGGVGESGMGAYHGKFSFDAFSHKKAVLYRSLLGDAALRYPPYTKRKLGLLKALITGNFFAIIRAIFGFSRD
ncbi:hypothetical protein SAY87_024629 [Trapa incisa]|uniref:Aldehyde dehydrogenase n=1 Tax=Trapa incisa TaxID=236973 RepID=A0AAN7G9X4_9MYRT|nr:hypothetical protein SAY87_024629 [Trapa incisa]